MNKITTLFLLMCFSSINSQTNFWENPAIVEEGKEPARAYFIPYDTQAEVLENDKTQSQHIQSLNGRWKFFFANKVAARPFEFYKEDLNEAGWKDIQVPGSWEMQGFGIPVYTNINYIFPKNPPFVDNNDLPIGTYRTKFRVDKKLSGKNVILHFGSIAGAATIYLNEKRIGYSKVSKNVAEFNITPYLKEGDNLLAIQIFKWSDASYIEDQDFFRLAGIERDVMLIARPDVSIEDFFVIGDLDSLYKNGMLKADIKVRNFSSKISDKHSIEVSFLDKNKKLLFQKKFDVDPINVKETKTFSFEQKINNPEKWSAEYPNLYSISMELKDASSKTMEVVGCRTGFRKMEIKNKQLLINGKPIIIRGVNSHEHHEKYGRYVDFKTKLKDIELMKLHNINALRTSHYPQSPEVYELCDKYGIYVVDEANIECHGLDRYNREKHPSFAPEWKGQHMDRTIRLFERDKNHACVITWSLGNESDFGPNYEATYTWLKEHDKAKRPVQCERARNNKFTDIICPMYTFPDKVEAYAKDSTSDRPFILCEYAHSMGNSTGNFQEYWDLFMKYPILQGGFIWDWVDQGLEMYNFEGAKYWAYGGDLGGYRWTHDENFCFNGLINADRTIHPAINEVKKVYQPIWFKVSDIEKGKIILYNYNLFTDLNAYNYTWKLYENGNQIASDAFHVEGKPLDKTVISLKLPVINFAPSKEYFLVVEARQKIAADLIPEGHVVASEQFAFPKNNFFVSQTVTGNLKVDKKGDTLYFESGQIKGYINLKRGRLEKYSYNGLNLITSAPKPNFWRAPIDNDFGNDMPRKLNIWRTADYSMQMENVTVGEQTPKGIDITINYRFFSFNIPYYIRYTIQNDASIVVTANIDMGTQELPELPRFGIKMHVPLELSNVSYYGRGPWENYSDRSTSAFIGKYNCTVADLAFNYSRPQENGYRTDVRIVSFTDSIGNGIIVEGIGTPICFNARDCYDEDLDPGLTKKQQHPFEVRKRKHLVLNIDYKQMGVGGNTSWGAWPLDKYRLLDKKYEYSFCIRPLK